MPEQEVVRGADGKWLFKKCPFCDNRHKGLFEDELDAAIMACRERHPKKKAVGSIEGWQEPDIGPIRPEIRAFESSRATTMDESVNG